MTGTDLIFFMSEIHDVVMMVFFKTQKIIPSYEIFYLYMQWFTNFYKMLEQCIFLHESQNGVVRIVAVESSATPLWKSQSLHIMTPSKEFWYLLSVGMIYS
jgi:hypothetical protein